MTDKRRVNGFMTRLDSSSLRQSHREDQSVPARMDEVRRVSSSTPVCVLLGEQCFNGIIKSRRPLHHVYHGFLNIALYAVGFYLRMFHIYVYIYHFYLVISMYMMSL